MSRGGGGGLESNRRSARLRLWQLAPAGNWAIWRRLIRSGYSFQADFIDFYEATGRWKVRDQTFQSEPLRWSMMPHLQRRQKTLASSGFSQCTAMILGWLLL